MTHKRKRANPSRVYVKTIARENSAFCSSGKDGFPTRAAARVEAARTAVAAHRDIAIYKCPECKLWHKTKQQGRTSNGTVIT